MSTVRSGPVDAMRFISSGKSSIKMRISISLAQSCTIYSRCVNISHWRHAKLSETRAQQEERVYRHLTEAKQRIEQDIAATSEIALKRIEVDAAAVVTLALVSELLPEHIQREVQGIIDLHEDVWSQDTSPYDGTTPRKPLGQRLIEQLTFFLRTPEKKTGRKDEAHDFLQSRR